MRQESEAAPHGGMPLAVLVLAYGGPRSLDEVETFLSRVITPRTPSPEMVERAHDRYRAIGGGSPLVENSFAQAAALESRLNSQEMQEKVAGALGTRAQVRAFLGMRFSPPSIPDALDQALAFAGCDRPLAAVILASHQSSRATGGYVSDARAALAAGAAGCAGSSSPPRIAFVPSWHTHPSFVDAVAARAREALDGCRADGNGGTLVLFTAHSLPLGRNGEHRDYEAGLLSTAEAVVDRLGPLPWRLAYQSATGREGVEWLGPDAAEVLQEEAATGRRRVAVVPLGFVSEHLETLYDLDIALAGEAARLGLGFSRARTVQDDAGFMSALADAVIACWAEAGIEGR